MAAWPLRWLPSPFEALTVNGKDERLHASSVSDIDVAEGRNRSPVRRERVSKRH